MPGFWSSETLNVRLRDLIEPFDELQIKNSSYELRLGEQAYVTHNNADHQDIPRHDIGLRQNQHVIIPPGQFSLLLTHEIVRIPNDAIGLISIKSKYKLWGLVNVSGFHVDPGFEGKLIFSVYNAGSQEICLSRSSSVFLLWYANLDSPSSDLYQGGQQGKLDIRDDEIMRIQGLPYNPSELAQIIRSLEETVENLQKSEDDRREKRRTLAWSVLSGVIGGTIVLLVSLGVDKWLM